MATSGTITGDTPELLKPLLQQFQATRMAMQKEIEKDPVPGVSCDQISSTVKWLKEVVQAMNAYSESFSRLSLSTLSQDELHRNQKLARESSLQLSRLFADKSKSFSKKSQCQLMKIGMGSQSSEIRENLSKFTKFLQHFSKAKWLGDLVAPEFEKQKSLTVKILTDLQTGSRLSLPDCGVKTHCSRCRQQTTKTRGFWSSDYFEELSEDEDYPSHGIPPKDPSFLFQGLESGEDGSCRESMECLVKMSEALTNAFRQDLQARKAAEEELTKKMDLLKDFVESANEVPKVLRRFLLIRAGSIGDLSELKAWVGEEEADEVQKMLEEFRDEANEEKVLRRLSRKRAVSEGSWSCVSAPSPRGQKKVQR
eukprot:Skav200276  [mRNA]  locus=scaffold93:144438:145538:- [translate_table: standard]